MKTKKIILKILKENKDLLKEKYNVKDIGLFGSYSRGTQTKKSDIDLLINFSEPIDFFKLFELEEFLSNLLGAKVEIVTPNSIKKIIKPYILQDIIYV